MSDTKFLKGMQLTRSEKIRCLILKTISIFTVMSLISCGKPIENKIKNQSFICTGTVLLDKEIQTCRNQEIKFSMILKEQNISVDYDPCFTNIEFEKLKKVIDNEMKVEFTRKFINPITNHEILHDFIINKVTGEFGIGVQDLQYVGMDSLSISGFCKKQIMLSFTQMIDPSLLFDPSVPLRPFTLSNVKEIPEYGSIIYTVFLDEEEFIYVGIGGLSGKKYPRSRIRQHTSGLRSGDQFCIYIQDFYVIPLLMSQPYVPKKGYIDQLTKEFIQKRLTYRYLVVQTEDSDKVVRKLEKDIQSGSFNGLKPTLNGAK